MNSVRSVKEYELEKVNIIEAREICSKAKRPKKEMVSEKGYLIGQNRR